MTDEGTYPNGRLPEQPQQEGEFRVPEGYFDELPARIRQRAEHDVPDGYFEQLGDRIHDRIRQQERRGRMRSLYWVAVAAAAAASVVYAALFLWPPGQSAPSFSQLASETPLGWEDLPYFAGEEQWDDLYLEEVDEWVSDTLVPPGAAPVAPPAADSAAAPAVKPSAPEATLNWDDLSEDEILDYLLEEGQDDLLQDMNP